LIFVSTVQILAGTLNITATSPKIEAPKKWRERQ